MAVSKKVEEKLEVVNGLDLIWESRAVYAEILYCFRECHNVCVGSGLFTKEIILQVDQCAVDFRRMSLDTTTVAKRVSNQWLDVAITFFENIDDIDDPKEMLQLLADQARDLARCFKLIAAWARDLGGRFHKAQDGTVKEADEFKAVFQASQESAENAKAQAEKALKSATKRREEAQDTEEAWMISAISLSWCPVANIVTGIGASVAGSSVTKARELEEKAAKELREAKVKLEKMTSDNERAKFVAGKAAKLVEVLGKLEEVCELIAAFWTMEAEKFDSQGAKMKTSQSSMIKFKSMRANVIKKNLKFWKEAKEDMDRYVTAMSVINNSFNFVTDATPPTSKSVRFEAIDLTLTLPRSVKELTTC